MARKKRSKEATPPSPNVSGLDDKQDAASSSFTSAQKGPSSHPAEPSPPLHRPMQPSAYQTHNLSPASNPPLSRTGGSSEKPSLKKSPHLFFHSKDEEWEAELKSARRSLHMNMAYVNIETLQNFLVQNKVVDQHHPSFGRDGRSIIVRILGTSYGFDFKRMIKDVQAVIESYAEVSGICTLHDLERLICEVLSMRLGKKPGLYRSYDELMLGPLCAHPLVQRYFATSKSLPDSLIPKITAGMVVEQMAQFILNVKDLRNYDCAELSSELVKKLLEQNKCQNIAELGIRLHKLDKTMVTYIMVLRNLKKLETIEQGAFTKKLHAALEKEKQVKVQSAKQEMDESITWFLRDLNAAMSSALHELEILLLASSSCGAGQGSETSTSFPQQMEVDPSPQLSPHDVESVIRSARQLAGSIKGIMQLVTGGGSRAPASVQPVPPASTSTTSSWRSRRPASGNQGKSDLSCSSSLEDPCDKVAWKHYVSDVSAQKFLLGDASSVLTSLSKMAAILVQMCSLVEARVAPGRGNQRKPGMTGFQRFSGVDRSRGRWRVSRQEVKEIVLASVKPGNVVNLSTLAALEEQLQFSFGVDSFSDLGSWPSLLAAMSDPYNTDLAEPLKLALGTLGQESGHTLALYGPVASTLTSALGPSLLRDRAALLVGMVGATELGDGSCSDDELASRLCSQFEVERVEDLGLGPLSEILAMCTADGSYLTATEAVLPVLGICAPEGLGNSGSHLASTLGEINEEEGMGEWDALALQRLRSAKPLTELHESMMWDEVFKPILGPLRKWVYQKPGQSLGVYVLDSPCGLYIVPSMGSMAGFTSGLKAMDAWDAASQLASVVMQSAVAGGNACSSSRLSDLCSWVTQVVVRYVDEVKGKDLEGEQALAALLLQLLQHLPSWQLRCTLFRPLLIGPLESCLGSHRCSGLLRQAAPPGTTAASMLQRLASKLAGSEPEFAAHWMRAWMKGGEFQLPEVGHPSPAIGTEHVHQADCDIKSPELTCTDVLVVEPDDGGSGQAAEEALEPQDERSGDEDATEEHKADEVAGVGGSWQQAFIEDEIRRKIYGKGVELSKEGQGVDGEKNRMLAASMSHLACDIYDDNLHFLLELVQNAEDNKYPEGISASLEFIRNATCMFAISNERGFSQENILSLCRIGMSSKTSAPGYIGQKGIGFKSVFKVSDAPEVHSNGFHIAFNLELEPSLGYACPTWVGPPGNESEWSSLCQVLRPEDVRTVIRIPLKQEYVEKTERLTNDLFSSVSPLLLLFLEKLCRISCIDAVSRRSNVSEKLVSPDRPNTVVLRQTEDGTCKSSSWLVVKSKFKPSVARNTAGKRIEVAETQVSLAFDLECRKDPNRPMDAQLVYAYLPLKSYALKFIVNADFIVTGSRKDVHKDEPWNVELRDHIATAFIAALHALPQDPETGPYLSLNFCLKCIPLPSVHLDFFHSLPRSISQAVLQEGCFLRSASGQRVSPREHKVRVCRDANLATLLRDPDLQACLSRQKFHFVHESLDALTTHRNAHELQSLLNVSQLLVDDLVSLLQGLQGLHSGPTAGFRRAAGDAAADGGAAGGGAAGGGAAGGGAAGSGIVGVGTADVAAAAAAAAAAADGDDDDDGNHSSPPDAAEQRTHTMLLVGNLLVVIYSMLNYHIPSDVMNRLKTIPFLPLSSGEFVSPMSSTRATRNGQLQVYLPLPSPTGSAREEGGSDGLAALVVQAASNLSAPCVEAGPGDVERPWESPSSQQLADCLHACHLKAPEIQGVAFVDPHFLELLESTEKRALLTSCLRDLQVEELSLDDVLHRHIYPTFSAARDALECTDSVEGPCMSMGSLKGDKGSMKGDRGIRLAQSMAFMLVSGTVTPRPSDFQHQKAVARALEHLRETAVLVCTGGLFTKCPVTAVDSLDSLSSDTCPHPVYLPCQLSQLPNLTSKFPTFDWKVVDYASYSMYGGAHPEAWAWLFGELGCTPFLRVLSVTWYPEAQGACAASASVEPLGVQGGMGLGSQGLQRLKICDWACPELPALVHSIKTMSVRQAAREQLGLLAQLLHSLWDSCYAAKMHAQGSLVAASLVPEGALGGQVPTGEGAGREGEAWGAPAAHSPLRGVAKHPNPAPRDYPSQFATSLRSLEWLPASSCAAYADVLPPSQLFSRCEAVTLALGHMVPYVDSELTGISDDSHMALALGVVQDLSVDHVLAVLRKWSGGVCKLRTSLRQMQNLYSYLYHECRKSPEGIGAAVSCAFNDAAVPLVWLPVKGSNAEIEAGEERDGCFYSWSSLCLHDSTGLMELTPEDKAPRRVLDKYYKEELPFFRGPGQRSHKDGTLCRQLSPYLPLWEHEKPPSHEYVAVLQHISTSCRTVEALPKVRQVLDMWEDQVKEGALHLHDLAALLQAASVIPTELGGWASLQDMPYLNDDDGLAEKFKASVGVVLVHSKLSSCELLLRLASEPSTHGLEASTHELEASTHGLRKLSSSVQRKPDFGMLRQSPIADSMVRCVLKHVQHFIWHHDKVHHDKWASKVAARLLAFKLFLVSKDTLNVRFSIDTLRGEVVSSEPCDAALDDGMVLYVCALDAFSHIADELTRIFYPRVNEKLSLFLCELMLKFTTQLREEQSAGSLDAAAVAVADAKVTELVERKGMNALPEDEASIWLVPQPMEAHLDVGLKGAADMGILHAEGEGEGEGEGDSAEEDAVHAEAVRRFQERAALLVDPSEERSKMVKDSVVKEKAVDEREKLWQVPGQGSLVVDLSGRGAADGSSEDRGDAAGADHGGLPINLGKGSFPKLATAPSSGASPNLSANECPPARVEAEGAESGKLQVHICGPGVGIADHPGRDEGTADLASVGPDHLPASHLDPCDHTADGESSVLGSLPSMPESGSSLALGTSSLVSGTSSQAAGGSSLTGGSDSLAGGSSSLAGGSLSMAGGSSSLAGASSRHHNSLIYDTHKHRGSRWGINPGRPGYSDEDCLQLVEEVSLKLTDMRQQQCSSALVHQQQCSSTFSLMCHRVDTRRLVTSMRYIHASGTFPGTEDLHFAVLGLPLLGLTFARSYLG